MEKKVSKLYVIVMIQTIIWIDYFETDRDIEIEKGKMCVILKFLLIDWRVKDYIIMMHLLV